MVNTALALAYLFPGADPTLDYKVGAAGVEVWNTAKLGPQPTPAEIAAAMLPAAKAQRIAQVKAKAREKILARMPEWKQANATARAVELVSLGQASGAEWTAMQAAWAWVKSVREYSNALEAQINASDDPATVDIATGWPT